jgi:hypothetical protein
VLFGAEFNAAIEQLAPTQAKPPRVLHPRAWQRVTGAGHDGELPAPGGQSDRRLS